MVGFEFGSMVSYGLAAAFLGPFRVSVHVTKPFEVLSHVRGLRIRVESNWGEAPRCNKCMGSREIRLPLQSCLVLLSVSGRHKPSSLPCYGVICTSYVCLPQCCHSVERSRSCR